MGLKLHKNAKGDWIRTWYADLWIDRRATCRSLGIPVEGNIPDYPNGNFSITVTGDTAFERSRKRAQKALNEILRKKEDDPAHIAKLAYNKATGRELEDIPLTDIAAKWRRLPKRRNTSETWLGVCDTFFDRFAAFAKTQYVGVGKGRRACKTLNAVTPEIAHAFFDKLSGEYTRETVKKQMRLLSSAFTQWATSGQPNPFSGFFSRSDASDEIPHEPFSRDELDRILEEAEADPKVYPLAVTAAFSGMRLGDVCRLQWKDIDLENRLISITTSKAKVRANIPIFDERLFAVLSKQMPEGELLRGYVFPEAAKAYDEKRDAVTRSIKPFIARAMFKKELAAAPAQIENEPEKKPPTLAEVRDIIERSRYTEEKRTRLFDTYARIKSGESYAHIQAATGRAKSTISADLQTVEQLTGETLRIRKQGGSVSAADLMRMTRQERKTGNHAASLYGWHSFRTTFVTLAVEAGIPPTDIGQIVGHTTAKMTLRYYKPRLRKEAQRMGKRLQGAFGSGGLLPSGETIDADAEAQNAAGATRTPLAALPAIEPTNAAAAIAATIQAVLSNPGLSDEAKSAAILALSSPVSK